ncbi:MAG TPA: cytochrome P450 [Dictyobacter sp.]|nr:cytochrome P450 [Dictyobacter sp.]
MQTMVQDFKTARAQNQYTFRTPLTENFPFTWYKHMRAEAPLYYDASMDAWSLFLYEDVKQVTTDYTTFSSRFPEVDITPDNLEARQIIRTDPPLHRQLRSLISQVFTPRRIETLEPMVTALCDATLQPLLDRQEIDIIDDIAYALPVAVISTMLGVPAEDQRYLKPFIDQAFAHRGDMLRTHSSLPGLQTIYEYFRELRKERLRTPQNDLISDLARADLAGERLSEEDLVSFCRILYSAGFVTTTNLIGNTFLCFQMFPEAEEQVRADLTLLPSTIEEVLRYSSSVQSITRLVTRDVELRGQQLHAGDNLIVYTGSANHDEAAFANPDVFDITRSNNKHFAFGHGIHFCIGAPLARLEAPIAIRQMLTHLHNIQLVPDTQLEPSAARSLYGVKHLPVTFTPVR